MERYFVLLFGEQAQPRGLMRVTFDATGVPILMAYWSRDERKFVESAGLIKYLNGSDGASREVTRSEFQSFLRSFGG